MTLAGLLLAAGRSERFGTQDKLLAAYQGAPLVTHAARALQGLAPDVLIAVTGSEPVAACLSGFTIVAPSGPGNGLSDSLRAGIAAADARGVARALVVLGDMPLVTEQHLKDVVAISSATAASATSDGRRPMPPACFPKIDFPDLMSLSGDQGARPLLSRIPPGRLIKTAPAILQDVDTLADLNRLPADLTNGA